MKLLATILLSVIVLTGCVSENREEVTEEEVKSSTIVQLIPIPKSEEKLIFGFEYEKETPMLIREELQYIYETETERHIITKEQDDIIMLVRDMAETSDIDIKDAWDIAWCESKFDPLAKNPNSTAKGVFQWLDSSWEYIEAEGHQFDAEENIKQFLKWYPLHPEWWLECN